MFRKVARTVTSAFAATVVSLAIIVAPSLAMATPIAPVPIPLPTYYHTPAGTNSPIVVANVPGTNTMMVAIQGSNIVVPFDPATGTYGSAIPIHSNAFGIGVTPDGKYVLATGYDCACVDMVAIDDHSDATVIGLPSGSGVAGITINSAGTKAYVYATVSGTVFEIDLGTKSYSRAGPLFGGQPVSGTLDHTGEYILINRQAHTHLARIHTTDLSIESYIYACSGPEWSVFSPDGAYLYVSCADVNSVVVLETTTYTSVATIPVGTQPWGMALSPDGNILAVDNRAANSMSLIDTATNTVFQTIELPESSGPWSSAFTANGQYLVTMLPDNSLIAVSKLFADPLPDTGATAGALSLSNLRLTALAVVGLIAVGGSLVLIARRRSRSSSHKF